MIEQLFRKDLKNFEPYGAEQRNYGIKLDANENPFSLLKILQEEIEGILQEDIFQRYPDPLGRAVCEAYGEYAKVPVKNMVLGNGSDELIQMIVQAFLSEGDKIVKLDPDFSMYELYTRIKGGRVKHFPLREDFTLEVDHLINFLQVEAPKIFFFSNPNNPTGGIIKEEAIKQILENYKGLVVVDEAYYEFYKETMVPYIENYENLIILRTASKAIGLAGIRLGFLLTNEKLCQEIWKVKPPFNVSTFSQAVGKVIFRHKTEIEEKVSVILKERERLFSSLKEFSFLKVHPSKGNFILVALKEAGKLAFYLEERGIKVRSFSKGVCKECLRITIGTPEENALLLKNLREYGSKK